MSRLVLKTLLVAAGAAMAVASRWSPSFRAALSRDRTIELETRDEVRHRSSCARAAAYSPFSRATSAPAGITAFTAAISS